jgi:hypothetical protein
MTHERPRPRGSGQAGSGGNAVERIERFTEVPMLVLAVAYVPVFIVEYLPYAPPEIRQDADIVQWTIVAAFALELLVKVAFADRGLPYLRSHWLRSS